MAEYAPKCEHCGHGLQEPQHLHNPEQGQMPTLLGPLRLPADTVPEYLAAIERLQEFRSRRPLQHNQELWATVRDLVHHWYTA